MRTIKMKLGRGFGQNLVGGLGNLGDLLQQMVRRGSPLLLMVSMLCWTGSLKAEPQAGQIFQDWKVGCTEPEDKKQAKQCYIFQNVVLRESRQALLNIAVGYRDNKPAAILTLPLGISLPPGISIQVDEGEATRIPIEICSKEGCLAGLLLESKLLSQFKTGKQARVTFQDSARKPVNIPVSLKGFSAGFDALRR